MYDKPVISAAKEFLREYPLPHLSQNRRQPICAFLLFAADAASDRYPTGRRAPLARCDHCRMPLFSFEGRAPAVSPRAWIAPTATLVGEVIVEDDASVWYGAVLRADFGRIIVRRGSNVQDGSVLHGGNDPVTEIGEGATIGHLCVDRRAHV